MLIGDLSVKIISFFLMVFLARYFSTEDFGTYNFVITYIMLFGVISGFGLDSVIIRDIARNSTITTKIISNALSVRIFTSICSIIIAITFIHLMNIPPTTILYVSITSLVLICQNLSYLYESLFKAKLKMEYYTISIIITRIIYGLLIFAVIFLEGNLIYIFFALIFSELVRACIGYIYSRKFTKAIPELDSDCLKYLMKNAIPFIMSSAFLVIYYRIDVVMLSILAGDISVGLYSAAYRLTDPLLFLPSAIAASLLPVMSRQYIKKKNTIQSTFTKGIKYTLILMLPIIISIFFISQKIINLVYGLDYSDSVIALQILIWALLFNSISSIQSSTLIAVNKQKLNAISIGICCLINIILNLLLIPEYSYIGAALATLVCVIILLFIQFYFLSGNISTNKYKMFLRPFLSAVLMGFVVYNLYDYNQFFSLIAGVLVYILSIVFLKSLTQEDLDIFRELIKHKL